MSEVNQSCLDKVKSYIATAKQNKKKFLLMISGVPGAGKTAIGQSIVYDQNKDGLANAVYLSGNGPLVEVLQYELNNIVGNKDAADNAIKGMKEFKASYFDSCRGKNTKIPEQKILVFDEAQRAWDSKKMKRGFSEPEGLLRVGDKIFEKNNYVVVIGLYGNGQEIYKGEEKGVSLWNQALGNHHDWSIITPENLASRVEEQSKIIDDSLHLDTSIRAEFVDCSNWAEYTISRKPDARRMANAELKKIQETSLQILLTRSKEELKTYKRMLDAVHPEWQYGLVASNYNAFSQGRTVSNGNYGRWFYENCKDLKTVCTVFGIQGLELDCPIVIWSDDYIIQNGQWAVNEGVHEYIKKDFDNPERIIENNYRVLLTRARKQLILYIPQRHYLDETYEYFKAMGVDHLKDILKNYTD